MATTPEEILTLHKGYADEFTQLASSGLLSAFNAFSQSGVFDYSPAVISINMPTFGRPNTGITLPDAPDQPSMPTLGVMKEMVEIPNYTGPQNAPTMPSALASIPRYTAPSKPSGSTPDLTATAPADATAPTMPALPNYLTINELRLPYPEVNIPTAPTWTDPVFEGRRPNDIAVPDPNTIISTYLTTLQNERARIPAFVRSNADALITSYAPEYPALRARINGILLSYTDPTTGGGAGIPAHIETAIMTRATGRNADEMTAAIDTASKELGKRGHVLPGPALQAVISDAVMKMGDANVKASADTAIKNVELEQKMFQDMVKLGESLEEKCLDVITQWLKLALDMDAQALAVAKEVIGAYLGAYNIAVMVYKSLWDGYIADAQILRARIEAINSRVNVYEAQIKAELAKTEVNKGTVDVLQALVQMNRVMADTYKAQVDAANSTMEVARINLAVFESKVRAHAATVSAYEARWNAYRAEVSGELGQFEAFSKQADAYTAQIKGYEAGIQGYSALVDAKARTNTALAGRNDATLRKYSVEADTQLKVFDKQITSFDIQSKAAIAQTQIELEYWRTTSNLIFQEFSVALNNTFEYAREQMNLFRGQMEAAISAANGLSQAANVAGQLASGAMTGLTSFAGNLVTSQG